MNPEVQILRRAHDLFAATPGPAALEAPPAAPAGLPGSAAGVGVVGIREQAGVWGARLDRARLVDAALEGLLAQARDDHREARASTGAVLAAARADAARVPDNPILARELLRRRIIRLRTQRAHVLAARRRAARRRAAARALRYRMGRRPAPRRGGPQERAVRAALSRIGRPYVWGATGPDRFDCSGLVQWAYAQAGVSLHRTTYEQIHEGVPVARSQVRPGDLVFPHAGHVQLAIGGGMVVEAPHAGSTVQISRMGQNVAIRRPL